MRDLHTKTLIFDLGGVILDLSVNQTLEAFSTLSGFEKERVQQIFQQSPGFELYERGAISDAEFRDFIRESYFPGASDQDIDKCWNAMLLSVPTEKLELLEQLKKSYHVILLSNTNTIHLAHINTVIMPTVSAMHSLDSFFHRSYYSHLMGMRKPDTEIFERVLDENNLVAEETLFLDDNKMNVDGAASIGIKTVHVTYSNLILEYFNA